MKLEKKRTILIGFAFMAICAFWQVYDSIVPLILKNTFDLNDAISGVIMAMDNVVALILLPLFGHLSDRVNTRIGRRMPFIICGMLASIVLMFLLPFADNRRILWMFILGLALVLLSMASFRSPAVALMPDVTPKPLRSKGNAIINLMGAVGGILMLAMIALLVPSGDHPNYLPLFAFAAGFMLACLLVLVTTTNEPRLVAKMQEESKALGVDDHMEKATEDGSPLQKVARRALRLELASVFLWYMGYNAITTSFSKYANVYWGLEGGSFAYTLMIAQAAAIATYVPAGLVATKIGRRRTILGGVALLAIAFGSCVFFKSFSGMIFFFFILAGVGWATINVNSYPMIVEMAGPGNVGRYTGYYYSASQAAQIITPILSGFVLEYGWKLLGSTNPDAGYVLLFPYGTLFVAASFVTILLLPHGHHTSNPEKKGILESFDVDD
jgi:MFS family permease